ncbi:MAG TPA: hypothetical protein VGP02_11670 [Mycobacteriales bacterium]|nr:hypothetical protein [Mycobacteriales bacterium]
MLVTVLLVLAALLPAPPAVDLVVVRGGDLYRAGVPLIRTGDARRPRWSPDGRRLAFLRGTDLWVAAGDGSSPTRVARGAGGPAWSPDGRWLAYVGDDGTLWRIRSDAPSGAPVRVLDTHLVLTPLPGDPSTVRGLAHDTSVAWSPDGARIAFPGGECLGVYERCLTVADLGTGAQYVLAAYGGAGARSGFAVLPRWTADGRRVVFTAYGRPGEQPGVPVHVASCAWAGTGCHTVGAPGDREAVPSPRPGSGDVVVTRYRDRVARVVLLSGEQAVAVSDGAQPDWRPGA